MIGGGAPVRDGDAVVFMNFRADRARQLTARVRARRRSTASTRAARALSRFVCLTEYDAKLPAPVAFAPDDLRNTLGEVLAAHGLTQLRIAETEKYAHVTFFFNGGREEPYAGEDAHPGAVPQGRDLRPAAGDELPGGHRQAGRRDPLAARIDVDLCNIANPDMVGHTGDPRRGDQGGARRSTSRSARSRAAVRDVGGEMLLTADHGNPEMMRDPDTGQPHTAHTVGPVPLVYCGPRAAALRSGGALRDVAPTLLDLLGLPQPAEMTGRSLLEPR